MECLKRVCLTKLKVEDSGGQKGTEGHRHWKCRRHVQPVPSVRKVHVPCALSLFGSYSAGTPGDLSYQTFSVSSDANITSSPLNPDLKHVASCSLSLFQRVKSTVRTQSVGRLLSCCCTISLLMQTVSSYTAVPSWLSANYGMECGSATRVR